MNAQDTAALQRLEIVQGRVREEVMEVQRLHVFATRLLEQMQHGSMEQHGSLELARTLDRAQEVVENGVRNLGMEKNVLLAMPVSPELHPVLEQRLVGAKQKLAAVASAQAALTMQRREHATHSLKRRVQVLQPMWTPAQTDSVLSALSATALATSAPPASLMADLVLLQSHADVLDRANAVAQLTASIQQLKDMFADVSVLLVHQHQCVQSIGDDMCRVSNRVQAGTQHLRAATSHAAAWRKRGCCCLVVFMLLIACAIVITAVTKWLSI